MNLHEDMPKKVNNFFASQPLDERKCDSNPRRPPRPPRLPRYFGLPMVHPSRPPLPPNRPYCWPLDYPEYVKDFDPNAHVSVCKVAIKINSETNDAKIVNLFSFTVRNIVSNWSNNYMGDYLYCTFVELQLTFCKRYRKV